MNLSFWDRQTASLFYDQLKSIDYDTEIPSLFQNYSHCFFNENISPEKMNFTNAKYRSADGTENNMKHKMLGASFTSFGRFVRADYDDKIHAVRKSVRGYNLPSTRNVVRKLFFHDEVHLNKFKGRKEIPNMNAVMFGQYIAHDLSSKQSVQYVDGGNGEFIKFFLRLECLYGFFYLTDGIRCCSNRNKNQLPLTLKHSACLPITISRSDSFYSPYNIKCMGFLRSSMISSNPHKIEVGEKANTVTSFLDNSCIYGSEGKTIKKVRSFNGGRLKTNLRNVLPMENGTYFSGDDRVNQTPFLAIFNSIFVRNHNHIADRLAVINAHWNEEKLFQEARKINTAVYQNVIYEEWLAIFLGINSTKRFENIEYDEKIDPSTSNDFSAGAFRFMHSFITTQFLLYDEDMNVKRLNLSDTIMKSKMLESFWDDVLRGLLKQKINLIGYSSEILNKLFKNKNEIGLDLMSMDILRGRDHGIPSYHKYRKFCNIKTNIKVFNDLFPHIPITAINQLRQSYKTVFDVDMLVAGAVESIPVNKNETGDGEGFFGPTFRCIISEQFYRLKAGDFYFYTHRYQFNEGKLASDLCFKWNF